MTRLSSMVLVLAALVVTIPGRGAVAAPEEPSLAGSWTLNRALSQFPREVGFGMDLVAAGGSGAGDRVGSESGDRSAVLRANLRPESEEEARNRQQLVNEVRTPPQRLTITHEQTAVTITDERGRSRMFHPDGRTEFQPLDASPVPTVSRWDAGRLIVRYKVQQDRELRYTFSRKADPPQLTVQVQFVERGGGDALTRIYEPLKPGEPLEPERQATPPAAPPSTAAPRPQPPSGIPAQPPSAAAGRSGPPRLYEPGQALVPASGGRGAAPAMDQQPDAELKGLTSLGVVVEDLDQAATTCGLRQDTLDRMIAKSLTDAGLKVVRNTDEDTYLYVHVTTTAMTTGFCFSRYDAFLYTHTTATLSYGMAPVLVQVSLLHDGGIAGGGASVHAEAVVRNLKQYVDSFAAKIRKANK